MAEKGEYEVVVVGAGPAGSATATFLAEAGRQVLLVDRARFPRPKPCAEYVSPGAERLLGRLGLLGQVERGLGRRLRGMQIVTPDGARFLVEYRMASGGAGERGGGQSHGFALPRESLDTALVAAARERGAEVRQGFQVTDLAQTGGAVQGVVGRDREGRVEEVRARLVVGADGLRSVVARSLGLWRKPRWPRRLGLVAHYRGVPWPEDFGRMYVGSSGYVGAAPLGGDLLSVGLVMPLPHQRMGCPDAAMDAALYQYPELAARLAQGQRVTPVRGVGPLARSVRSCAGAGYLLVGDAAGFFDPFTGEGIYRALRGAELASQVAVAALEDDDLTAPRLRTYAHLRARELSAKERLTRLIQIFVQLPPLMSYAIPRLGRSSLAAQRLSLALGDLAPAERVLEPATLWELLRP